MSGSKIEKLRAFVQANPGDARARFFLASELFKESEWAAASAEFEEYLASAPADPAARHLPLEKTACLIEPLTPTELDQVWCCGCSPQKRVKVGKIIGCIGLLNQIRCCNGKQ